MTGEEAKAIIVAIFGERAPTCRAARALDIEPRTLQRMFRRRQISRRDEFALMELQRRHRVRSHDEAVAALHAEVKRQWTAQSAEELSQEPKR